MLHALIAEWRTNADSDEAIARNVAQHDASKSEMFGRAAQQREDADELENALADTRSRPSLDWQTIETAPKVDSRILILGATNERPCLGFWSARLTHWMKSGATSETIIYPTHWTHIKDLPASPTPETPK